MEWNTLGSPLEPRACLLNFSASQPQRLLFQNNIPKSLSRFTLVFVFRVSCTGIGPHSVFKRVPLLSDVIRFYVVPLPHFAPLLPSPIHRPCPIIYRHILGYSTVRPPDISARVFRAQQRCILKGRVAEHRWPDRSGCS